jgi:hypothetical protein
MTAFSELSNSKRAAILCVFPTVAALVVAAEQRAFSE